MWRDQSRTHKKPLGKISPVTLNPIILLFNASAKLLEDQKPAEVKYVLTIGIVLINRGMHNKIDHNIMNNE